MKKKFLKVILIITVTVALICCCCFSAYAASTESPINDAVVVDGNIKFHLQVAGPYDSYWTRGAYIPEAMSGTMYLCTNANITLDHSNVFKWNAFMFSLWNKSSGVSYISDISFVLLDENYNVLATLYERAFSDTEFWQDHFDIPAGQYTTNSAIDVKYIALSFNFSTLGQGILYYYFNGYSFGYSVIDTATAEQEKTNDLLGDITDDKYTPPSGGAIDDVGSVEGEIQNSTQEGFNALTDTFKAFSLDTFTDGLGGIAAIYNHIIPKCPWLFSLINISLGLGLFAFLLGLSLHTVSAFNNRDKGSARHDAKYIKRDGIASHRPSRK